MANLIGKLTFEIDANTNNITDTMKDTIQSITAMDTRLQRSLQGVVKLTGDYSQSFKSALERWEGVGVSTFTGRHKQEIAKLGADVEDAISKGDWDTAIKQAINFREVLINTKAPLELLVTAQTNLNNITLQAASAQQKLEDRNNALGVAFNYAAQQNVKFNATLAQSLVKANNYADAFNLLRNAAKSARLIDIDKVTGAQRVDVSGAPAFIETSESREAMALLVKLQREYASAQADVLINDAAQLASVGRKRDAAKKLTQALQFENLTYDYRERIVKQLEVVSRNAARTHQADYKVRVQSIYDELEALKQQGQYLDAKILSERYLEDFQAINKKADVERDLIDINKILLIDQLKITAATKSAKDAVDEYKNGIAGLNLSTVQAVEVNKALAKAIVETTNAKAADFAKSGQYAKAAKLMEGTGNELKQAGLFTYLSNTMSRDFEQSFESYVSKATEGFTRKVIQQVNSILYAANSATKDQAIKDAKDVLEKAFGIGGAPTKEFQALSKDYKDRVTDLYSTVDKAFAEMQRSKGDSLAKSTLAEGRAIMSSGQYTKAIGHVESKIGELKNTLGETSKEFQSFLNRLGTLTKVFFAKDIDKVSNLFSAFMTEAKIEFDIGNFEEAVSILRDFDKIRQNFPEIAFNFDEKMLLEYNRARSQAEAAKASQDIRTLGEGPDIEVANFKRITDIQTAFAKMPGILQKDIEKVDKVAREVFANILNSAKGLNEDMKAVALRTAESFKLEGDFESAIAVLSTLESHFKNVFGEGAHQVIAVSNEIKKLEIQFQNIQNSDAEKTMGAILETAKRLSAEAGISTNQIVANDKYARSLELVQQGLENLTQYSKKAAEAQDFLAKTSRAAADKSAQFTIENLKNMANAGDVKGALEALQQFRDQVANASTLSESLTFEIENNSKAYKELQTQVGAVNAKIEQLVNSGAENLSEFNKLSDESMSLSTKMKNVEVALAEYRRELARIDKSHIVSQKTVKQLGTEITSMTKRAQSVWRRFNLDPAQLTQAFMGASIGAYSLYDAIQNAATSLKDFMITSVTTANELQRISYSAVLVTKDLTTFAQISEIADKNQRLFGGTLNENLKELTGFTLVARTAGVNLESLVSTSQRLAAFDPGQGIQGASISLREFLAGNIRSLRERFELPANILKDLGDASLDAQQKLDKLSSFLDAQGLSAGNLEGQLNLTQQAYRDFSINWEKLTLSVGAVTAETFAGAVRNIGYATDALTDFINNPYNRAMSLTERPNWLYIIPDPRELVDNARRTVASVMDTLIAPTEFKAELMVALDPKGLQPGEWQKFKNQVQSILERTPEAELKIAIAIKEFERNGDFEKLKEQLAGLQKEADKVFEGRQARGFISNFFNTTDIEYVKDYRDRLAEVASKSSTAAIAVRALLEDIIAGEVPVANLEQEVLKLDEAFKGYVQTERYASEAQKRRDEGLQTYTQSYANLIVLVKELSSLNLETGLFTQAESGGLLAYVQSEIERVRSEDLKGQFTELLNQAADAAIQGITPPPGVLEALMRLTGSTSEDLELIINGYTRVRVAQNQASTAGFEYSRAALEVSAKNALLAGSVTLAENAFKEYQQTGILTDEVMAKLLQITDETGKKIYANEGAVYAAANAYVVWKNALSETGQGMNDLALDAINLAIAETNRQIAQQLGVEAFKEYAESQKISAHNMENLLEVTDKNGVKLYENEEAVYAAAEAYKELIELQKELEGLTNRVTSATNASTNAQDQFTGASLLARIATEKNNATQRIAEAILNGVADGAVLTAEKQAFLQSALGKTGISVSRLTKLWQDLIIAQNFGALMETNPMINQMFRDGASLAEIQDYIATLYGLGDFFGGGDSGGGGGGGGGGDDPARKLEDFLKEMKDIVEEYRDEVLEAEREYQQELLDIQEEFQAKQLKSLKESEVSKRRGRVSFYRGLIDAELPQESKQKYAAQFEEIFTTSMKTMSEGKIELGKSILELGTEHIERNMSYESDIAQAIKDGDLARADALRNLQGMDQEIYDFQMRTLIEEGDPNLQERDQAVLDANQKMTESIDAINIKAADRAKILLESEPEIAKNLAATNQEYDDMIGFITEVAGYVSPLQQGLNDATTSTNNLLSKTKELVDFVKNNPIGRIFVQGITAGVEAEAPALEATIDNTGNQMVDYAKNSLEAQSPSRRTMREVGVPFAQGIAAGIKAYAKNIEATAVSAMNRTVEAVKKIQAELPTGIKKSQENIDAFKTMAQTNISILEGLRGLLPDQGGSAEGRAQYVAAISKIDQDTEAQITARRQKLAQDVLLARTDDERRILEAIAQQDISLLQQQANIQKSAQEEEMRNVADQEAIDSKMSEIQQNAANQLKALQERMAELAKTDPAEAARRYEIRAQQILERANLQQELQRYLLENNLTTDDAYASLLRQQIQQLNALANMEVFGTGVGNAAINNTVYNINMDLTGSNLKRSDVRQIVKEELDKLVSITRGSTA